MVVGIGPLAWTSIARIGAAPGPDQGVLSPPFSNLKGYENVTLPPPHLHTIDTAMEWIDKDELLEVTPDAVRARKQVLDQNKRPRRDEG